VCLYVPYAAFGAWYARVRATSRWIAIERVTWPVMLITGLGLRAWFTLLDAPPSSEYVVSALTIAMNVLPSLGVLGLARALVTRSPRIAEVAVGLAPSVFGVYLAHPLVLLALERAAARLLGEPVTVWPWVVVAWPGVTTVCFVLVTLTARYRSLWWLHGVTSGSVPARRLQGT
jgi:surface polysaccharide O-acyltransferase-like enzyme